MIFSLEIKVTTRPVSRNYATSLISQLGLDLSRTTGPVMGNLSRTWASVLLFHVCDDRLCYKYYLPTIY